VANHGVKVIDFHSHFPTSNWYGRSGRRQRLLEKYGEERVRIFYEQSREYRSEWRMQWGFDPPESERPSDEDQAARWAADLDLKRVERVNFVTGGGNENLARIVEMYPDKFTGFAHHALFEEGAAEELERAVEDLGLRGYKLIGSAQTTPVDDEAAYPVWETAERLGVPVLIHFGVLGGGGGPPYDLRNMNPLTLWEPAKMFPRLNFVIPHFGSGYLRELLQLCWSCPNVLIDTSGSNQWMRWMPFELDLEGLFRKAIETVGPERILFATDSSYFPRGFSEIYLRDQLKACRYIGLDEGSIEKIFYGNAAKLLKL
jgi:predicted TIM-barrel fold metal-dependent hydrolase